MYINTHTHSYYIKFKKKGLKAKKKNAETIIKEPVSKVGSVSHFAFFFFFYRLCFFFFYLKEFDLRSLLGVLVHKRVHGAASSARLFLPLVGFSINTAAVEQLRRNNGSRSSTFKIYLK